MAQRRKAERRRGPGTAKWCHGRSPAQHIGGSTQTSPYVSLTRSFAVAWDYAALGGRALPSKSDPAFVYEIEIDGAAACRLLDPIKEIAQALPMPLASPGFHHDGDQRALVGIVDATQAWLLQRAVRYPPPQPAKPYVNVGPELVALVRALRDAEILVVDHIPARCVVARHDVWQSLLDEGRLAWRGRTGFTKRRYPSSTQRTRR